MTSKRFNPEKDLAPMPFDEGICLRALEMKKRGLAWRPHVGCFVWDPDEVLKPDSPFPGRIYFILSLQRFIEIFETIERMIEKLVWLPTWHQARLICRRMGTSHDSPEFKKLLEQTRSPTEDLLAIYGLITDALQKRP